jgi:NDP-sugar pyrophosphorylase family protein
MGSMKVVILAGGRGTRLAPYTSVLPKPLLPVDGRSVLEIVVERLAATGFDDIVFSVGYLGHLIEAVFGDGSSRGVRITYLREDEPLGTAGPLRRIGDVDGTFLAMNGDVLTDLDPRDLLRAHREGGNAMTLATRHRVAKIDYGVLHLDGEGGPTSRVAAFTEKPELPAIVSMGVYALEPDVLDFIPPGPFDIPDLVLALLDAGAPVGAYLFDGFWLDIGRPEDFQNAVELFAHDADLGRVEAPKAPETPRLSGPSLAA